MDPFCPAPGGLQCSPPLGAQQTLGLNTEGTGPAQPAPNGDLQDAIARLWRHEGPGLMPAAQHEQTPSVIPTFLTAAASQETAASTQHQSHRQGAEALPYCFPCFHVDAHMADQYFNPAF